MNALPPPPLPPRPGPSLLSLERKDSRTSVQLDEALYDRNLQRFRNILNSGFEQGDLVRSMHTAIERNLPEHVAEIVSRGFPITGQHAVKAIQRGSKEVIRALQHLGWDINEPLSRLDPPALAYAFNNEEMTLWLLDQGADLNQECFVGATPLSIAVKRASPQMVEILLGRGGDTQKGHLLHYALDREEDVITVLALLLARGAPLNSIMYKPGSDAWMFYFWMGMGTPLHKAVESGKVDVVRYLLDQGADVDVENPKGQTALDVAKRLGYSEIAPLLYSRTHRKNQ